MAVVLRRDRRTHHPDLVLRRRGGIASRLVLLLTLSVTIFSFRRPLTAWCFGANTARTPNLVRSSAAAPLQAHGAATEPPVRVGHGFDIHRMIALDSPEVHGPVTIGGEVFDDFNLGIVAHSDGDVVYHSVVDAIFGALSLPDIGQFFPDTDPRWKGAQSSVFMEEAWNQMDLRGYRVGNVDVTIIAEAPKMIVKDSPLGKPGQPYDHKAKMRENIARLLHCAEDRVNVKARTHEKVDAVGEKRALSCHVVMAMERA